MRKRAPEDVLEQHRYTAMRVIKALYAILGVKQHFVRSHRFPEDAQEHPGVDVAFSRARRLVYYRDQQTSLLYLPHEAVHCVWPNVPVDPEEEWLSGLIPYEIAWLRHLCRTPVRKVCLQAWLEYANEGREAADDLNAVGDEARNIVRFHQLPDPWAHEVMKSCGNVQRSTYTKSF